MSHHTEECKRNRRLRKKFAWIAVARGRIIILEDIIVEEIYGELPHWGYIPDNAPSYGWKVVKRWPVDMFEKKHGPFDESKIHEHGK